MEKTSLAQPLLLEHAAKWSMRLFRENKLPFLTSLFFGFLAYTFAFTNKLINHDEAGQLFGKGATVTSGRWGLGALDSIFPNYSMPWIYGLITLFLIAVSICLILRIFQIRHKTLQVLLAGSVMVFPSLIGLFGYMFTASSYALSFFFSILSVWFLTQPKRWYWLPALVSMILSLSIYQSYISIAASLLVLLVIQKLLTENTVFPAIRAGIGYVLFLIASLALYYLATQVVFLITGTEFNSYASDSITLSLSSIITSIGLAYENFWQVLTNHHHSLIVTGFSQFLHWTLLGCTAILLIAWAIPKKENRLARLLLIAALLILLPLAMNCMYLITSADSIHTLVLYSFIAIYVLAAMVADTVLPLHWQSKSLSLCRIIALNIVTLALAGILVSNTYVANEAYLNLYLNYENAYTFYSTLFADIKMMPEFDEDTKIAIIGYMPDSEYNSLHFSFTHNLTGIRGFLPNTYSQQEFMEFYLGVAIDFASAEEIEAISASPEYQQMPVYPYYGSMQMMGDFLVVKLS